MSYQVVRLKKIARENNPTYKNILGQMEKAAEKGLHQIILTKKEGDDFPATYPPFADIGQLAAALFFLKKDCFTVEGEVFDDTITIRL